jgi:hypothetical protein
VALTESGTGLLPITIKVIRGIKISIAVARQTPSTTVLDVQFGSCGVFRGMIVAAVRRSKFLLEYMCLVQDAM